MKPSPPHRALKFLRWFCREDYLEEVEGDLIEIFEYQHEKSPDAAKRKFQWSVIRYFRPEFLKVFYSSQHPNTIAMVKNDLKIAWRLLLKQKMYSSIKIGGFALGIAACLLIALFVKDELRYDQHYKAKDEIFRLIFQFEEEGKTDGWVWFPAPTSKVLVSDFPEIEQSGRLLNSRLFGGGSNEIRRAEGKQNFHETGFVFVDPSLLNILEIEFIKGNKELALSDPGTMVISERKALKYFPNEDPIGKTVLLNDDKEQSYTITGVVKLEEASHLQYDFFMTLSEVSFWNGEQDFWNATNYHTYVKVHPQTDVEALNKKLNLLTKNYFAPAWIAAGDQGVEEASKRTSYKLQPVSDIHLYNGKIADKLSHGDIRFVWLFSAVAGFILLIAAINFINLSTAKSANRALEVGLRKTVGSNRQSLINQFLTESFLYSFISFALALVFAVFLLPYFNSLSGKSLILPWTEWWFLPSIFGLCLTLGLLAGCYPAIYLSSFKPINVLKGSISKGSKSASMRSTLVVFQFTTSVILIIATLVIYRQMNFILQKDLGFDKDQVVMIKGTNTLGEKLPAFKDELLALSTVENVSVGNYLPIDGTLRDSNGFYKEGMEGKETAVLGQIWSVDTDYIKTLGINLIEGRNFYPNMASESSSMIINQTMAKEFGFTNPIGRRIENFQGPRTIIGVVEDFHFESMKGKITPLCLVLGNSTATTSVKIQSGDVAGALSSIEEKWQKFSPNQEIRYSFLDDSFAHMYSDIFRMGQIFTSFTVLAIIVACLGLFALSAFMVEQRTKEIGIRLVLGARLKHIFKLLTINFVKLIAVSILIACPVGWYVMREWLSDYTYRVNIGFDLFIISSALVLVISILTISYQSIKAGLISPAKTLRS